MIAHAHKLKGFSLSLHTSMNWPLQVSGHDQLPQVPSDKLNQKTEIGKA